MLRWVAKNGNIVFAKQSSGVKGLPFLAAALPAARD
jgi:hypothetical protein